MIEQNLPPDIIRVLSFHGPADVGVGEGSHRAGARISIAPFEDRIYLLFRAGNPIEAALLRSNRVELQAKKPDGSYLLRISGRGHAGRPLGGHPDRGAIEPWLPEGMRTHGVIAAPFTPEEIDFSRAEGDDRARYSGRTPAGKRRPSASAAWLRAAYGGFAGLLVVPSLVVPWLWLTLQGAEYFARLPAFFITTFAGLVMLGAARLSTLPFAFRRWRSSRARDTDVPVLLEALLSPTEVGQVAAAGGVLAVLLLLQIAWIWGGGLLLIALFANGAWLVGPASWAHLAMGKPESTS